MAFRSRDEHDLIRLQERKEDVRREDDVGSRMQLRASRRPLLQYECICEPTDALVVPQPHGEEAVRRIPEPHAADVRETLIRRHIGRAQRAEQRERPELVCRRDVLNPEDGGGVPRHRRGGDQRDDEARHEEGPRGAEPGDASPGGDERHRDEDSQSVVEEIEGAVDEQEAARIQAAKQSEQDQCDGSDEHRDDEVVRPGHRASHQLETGHHEGREHGGGGQELEHGGARPFGPDEQVRRGVSEQQNESEDRRKDRLGRRRDETTAEAGLRGPGHRGEEGSQEHDHREEQRKGVGGEDVREEGQVHGHVVGPCTEGQRRPGDDIEGEDPPGETSSRESPTMFEDHEGRDHAEGQERCEGVQEREEEQQEDRERPHPRILAFAEEEHRHGEDEEADRFLRGGARQEKEAAEERDEKACDKPAKPTAGRLRPEHVRRKDREAREERQDQLHMEEGREASHLRSGGPQEGEAGQFLIVAVRIGRIDSPGAVCRDVRRNPREGESVDAERKGTEGERYQPGRESEAQEGGDDRPVRPQPRRIASSDCTGSTAIVSRMDSVGRSRRVPRRSTNAEPIDTPTSRRTMSANVTKSKTIGTWWPNTTTSTPGWRNFPTKKPISAPTTPARRENGIVSRRSRRCIHPLLAPIARRIPTAATRSAKALAWTAWTPKATRIAR